MEKNSGGIEFLNRIVGEINEKDKLHSKKISANLNYINENYLDQLGELSSLVSAYFDKLQISPGKVAEDYLKMVNDYRREGIYFYRNGEYRCKNQDDAFRNVYSKTEVMSYYMNALLISQVLWKHHFRLFVYFREKIKTLFAGETRPGVLDVGPGHGFFSFLVMREFPAYEHLDIVDISETSLSMTKSIIGFDAEKINYFNKNVFDFDESNKYDLILLGEVIEHLDKPKDILVKLSHLLTKNGLLWITTPTNSPAIDHVYLFNSKDEVIDLMSDAGLVVVDTVNFYAEDVDDETAKKNKVTDLVGLFCKRK